MTSPLPLPDWVPPWAQLVILVAVLLFGLMFLLMPFAVFGVKGRLDMLEARLDEIQGEIRSLALRLPEPGGDDGPAVPGRMRTGDAGARRHGRPGYDPGYDEDERRPPIPPAPPPDRPPASGPARVRTEPRLR